MAYAAGRKYGCDIVQGRSQGATHLVDVVPLLRRHRSTHIVRSHLGLVEEPLKDEERS